MKYFVVDDNHELYDVMYADLFNTTKYCIEEVSIFKHKNAVFDLLTKLHFSDKINRHVWLPLKGVWNKSYSLSSYHFDEKEVYWIIFLNGTLRNFFSYEYLSRLKRDNANIKLALVMYDSFSNSSTKRVISMMDVFDKVFSFDEDDCKKHNMDFIYSTFSYPVFVKKDDNYKNSAFFVGAAVNRLEILQESFHSIASRIEGCEFRIVGVPDKNIRYASEITYNKRLNYKDALMYSFNSECIVELVREGQVGVSLRTCEAIMFNKKLLTNNEKVKEMPFYNPDYIHVFDEIDEEAIRFIKEKKEVKYDYDGYFSPLCIIDKLASN